MVVVLALHFLLYLVMTQSWTTSASPANCVLCLPAPVIAKALKGTTRTELNNTRMKIPASTIPIFPPLILQSTFDSLYELYYKKMIYESIFSRFGKNFDYKIKQVSKIEVTRMQKHAYCPSSFGHDLVTLVACKQKLN